MTTKTTMDTITREQIEALSREAAEAGDDEQVRLCKLAMTGSVGALKECVRVIANAEAQN